MKIRLEGWYDQPVHCPFCGSATKSDEPEVSCRHWLYTAYFEFLARSDRFNKIAGLPESLDDELSLEESKIFGDIYEVLEKNRSKINNLVEYELLSPGDITLIAFAPIDEELVGWGRNHISPYE